MGEVFVLEPPPEPITVHVTNARNLLSGTIHLTDNRTTTLCGQDGPLVLAQKKFPATCRTCVKAASGKARVKRVIR